MRLAPAPRAWLLVVPSVFLLAWGGNHFTPLLHLYETVGGYAPWQANLLLGMYVFGLVPGLLVAAALSDRHGRKPVTAAGMAASILGSVVLACSLHSFLLLCLGRLLAGVGVGVGMSVGSSWIKELSFPPWDPGAGVAAGAKRSSLTLTLGFALGAGVTGVVAQWAPWPGQSPYVVHLVLCVVALALLARAPESLASERRVRQAWWRALRVPSAGQRDFRWLILPAAPWVFAAAGVAYAVMPAVVESSLGEWATLYATALAVVTLGVGAVAQTAVGFLNRVTGGHALIVGLAGMTAGMVLAAVAARVADPVLAFAVAVVLGASYGVCVVAGLLLVQGMAAPGDLAGMTGIYYSLAYLGFLLPAVLAALHPVLAYPPGLVVVAVVCAGSLAAVTAAFRRRRI
ncbi:MFS transporter [Rothia sp. AR01]|uniref:MFS transporter n=1 Tax=Rothia santali TaxID=2949643 RepID=A0A9X2HAT7_9MICC|nr:MFS transporter [Rothia santali]MCP3424730.1 MFS transporter [Rothia santali]